MLADFVIGTTEIVVALVIAGIVWALYEVASITKTRP